MSLSDPHHLKAEYESRANQLLRNGFLGMGAHEDRLIQAASWFDRPLGAGNGTLADFFRAALENHVQLFFAVAPANDHEAADLFSFLQVILYWLRSLPLPLLKKSPEPLTLIVAETAGASKLGAQIMRRGGPSFIYWSLFRKERSASMSDYWPISDQVRRTIVHEMIGHQFAFCAAVPLVTRDDLREIFRVLDLRRLKLIDSTSVDVAKLLEKDDMLDVVSCVHYSQGGYDPEKYYANFTELIAFAAEGSSPGTGLPYAAIHTILKHGLFRLPDALNAPAAGQGTLYQGYDMALPSVPKYFLNLKEGVWTETQAIQRDNRWLALDWLFDAARSAPASRATEAAQNAIAPTSVFNLRVSFGGYLVKLGGASFLASPFGLYGNLGGAEPVAHHLPLKRTDMTIEGVPGHNNRGWTGFAIKNLSDHPLPLELVQLEATSPDARSVTSEKSSD